MSFYKKNAVVSLCLSHSRVAAWGPSRPSPHTPEWPIRFVQKYEPKQCSPEMISHKIVDNTFGDSIANVIWKWLLLSLSSVWSLSFWRIMKAPGSLFMLFLEACNCVYHNLMPMQNFFLHTFPFSTLLNVMMRSKRRLDVLTPITIPFSLVYTTWQFWRLHGRALRKEPLSSKTAGEYRKKNSTALRVTR